MKTQMLEYLRGLYGNGWEDTAEIAIYWFANDYHDGQSSELYSILSTSPYHPSPLARGIESEDDMSQDMYEDLVCVYNV
jgi:hypothetical protein